MAVFSQSRNMTQGKFMKPPDKPKPDRPKLPFLQLKEPSPFHDETNEIEFPPWLQPSRANKVVKPSNKKTAVSFVVPKKTRKERRRRGTLYDAVAGRMCRRGFIKKPRASRYRDTASSGGERVLPPEEVLIRRPHYLNNKLKGEPYFAHEHLPRKMRLPSSDMLTAIHAHAADFFKYSMKIFKPVYQSMDESALLAFGILAEELAKEKFGAVGHRVLLDDPEATDNEDMDNPIPQRLRTRKSRREKYHDPNYRISVGPWGERFIRTRQKRVKTAADAEKPKQPRRRKQRVPEWHQRELQSFEKWLKEQEQLMQQEEEQQQQQEQQQEQLRHQRQQQWQQRQQQWQQWQQQQQHQDNPR